jgi:hypothetical protein
MVGSNSDLVSAVNGNADPISKQRAERAGDDGKGMKFMKRFWKRYTHPVIPQAKEYPAERIRTLGPQVWKPPFPEAEMSVQ